MVLAENTSFASWVGSFGSATNGLVWPATLTKPSRRHPSRNRVNNLPRSAGRPRIQKRQDEINATLDHRATWYAKILAAKRARKSRELQLVGCYSGMIAALVAVGVFALQQDRVPTSQQDGIAIQTSVVGLGQTPRAEFPTLPANDAQFAPQMPTQSDIAALSASTVVAPMVPTQITTRARQPAITDRAPRSLAAPLQSASSGMTSQVYAFPELAIPSTLNAPDLPRPFVCTSCASAFPRFGQVMFDVQSPDIAAANVQDLMVSLAEYQSTVRQSQIELATSQVRFYRASDAEAAASLASRYNAELVDLTWFAPDENIAKIDVILAPDSAVFTTGNGQ